MQFEELFKYNSDRFYKDIENIGTREREREREREGGVEALMRADYQVICQQDGESMDIVMIDYVHPKYEGHWFEECGE